MSYTLEKLVVLLLVTVSVAQVTVKRYEVFEIHLKGTPTGNPFQENVQVTFSLSQPNDQTSRYPTAVSTGYYVGDGTWHVRFSPDVEGTWSWVSSSPNSDLHGVKGQFVCQGKDEAAHGGLLVDPNHKHHFIYEDGSRYLLVGYEADWLWALGLPGVNTGGVTLDGFVSMTTSYGFNHFLVNVYANETSWAKHVPNPPRVSPTSLTPWGYNGNLDYGKIDVTYMDHLDATIQTLNKYGAICHLMITVWNKAVAWPAKESPDDDLYWRYVVSRFGAYSNVIFDISKEANREPDSYWATRLTLLSKLNTHKRLVTSHTHCPDWSYCDFISAQVHSNYYDNIISSRKAHDIPVANVEFQYETGPIRTYGRNSSAEVMLQTMWSLYMAGGYGAWYYEDTAWDVITMDQTHGYKYCKNLKAFFEGVPYYEMNPDNSVISDITNNVEVWGLTSPGKEYVVFARDHCSFTLTLSGVSGDLKAEWYGPRGGDTFPVNGTFSNGAHKFTVPSFATKELVLHLH